MARVYYDRGGITIWHGDFREVLPQIEVLPSMRSAVMVTDPPYGIAHSSNHGASWRGTEIAGDRSTEVRDRALELWGDRPAIVFGSWKVERPERTRAVLVWDKGPASGMGDLSFPWKLSWEEIYVLGEGFHGRRDEGVLRFNVVTWESKGRGHPHQKPLGLMKHLVNKCPPGVVVDPFCGSGATLRAAKDLGRRAIGIEDKECYCELAAKRLAQEVFAFE